MVISLNYTFAIVITYMVVHSYEQIHNIYHCYCDHCYFLFQAHMTVWCAVNVTYPLSINN